MVASKIVFSFATYLLVFVYCQDRSSAKNGNMETIPNILFILADDLGWGNVAWHNHNTENNEIHTPNMDNLIANGLLLNRHYVDMGCSPTRASFQTGRIPIHVTTNNGDGLEDPTHGIPTKMTTIASKLKEAGYGTHLVGKWDCGFATYSKIPTNKGYDTFYGYLSKSITYFSKLTDNDCGGTAIVDLWENDIPAHSSMAEIDDNLYIEFSFMRRVMDLIDTYGTSESTNPFFIMYSMHLVHYPTEIPVDYLETFNNDENMCQIDNDQIYPGFADGDLFQCRSTLQSQVNLMDHIIGQVIDRLKENNLYDNTLIVFSSDNGGSLEFDNTAGNNYPLRGGKSSYWEGGIRSASFVSGGYLPHSRRGEVETGLMHIADWYSTFCSLSGLDTNDYVAINAGLPNVDGYNMWPLLSGEISDSPRKEVAISPYTLIYGNYKLITESQRFSVWSEPIFPNSDTPDQYILESTHAGCADKGCLFDLINDPSEFNDISETFPVIKDILGQRMKEIASTIFENDETSGSNACPGWVDITPFFCGCWMAINNYNYFVGPYQDLTEQQIHFIDSESYVVNNHIMGQIQRPNSYYAYVYLVLFTLTFVGIIGFIKFFCTFSNRKMNNEQLYDIQESYGAI